MRTATRTGALGAPAALLLALAACGGGHAGSMDHSSTGSSTTTSTTSPSSPSASVDAAHDDQDVAFAQQMIVHHQSAIDMAEMATAKASSREVEDIARGVETAQGPEIDTLTSWLIAWGEPVTAEPSTSGSSMSGTDHSAAGHPGTDVPGTMTDEQMSRLDAATGTDFDELFLQLMTAHHQGAIEMARTEQDEGSNPQAIALAGEIVSSQSAEVDRMDQVLTALR